MTEEKKSTLEKLYELAAKLPPLERRSTPEFHRYFDLIWKELDVHG